ncbi:hypothetical protein AVEN_111359-1 [Araneus ventricosus]|uniref:Uncharacterized protein n=1 Tax=Araneus ventricosus TaxID=182803 RepID=A0A4Y2MMD6_ARAVE|nr:hypothetical protein AVEN_111359-1 [Araneus ventricosus]
MDPGSELARSPSFVCKGFLLTISMFAGFFGFFFSIWKNMHYAVPSFLFLEMTSIILLNVYAHYMKGRLFTKFTPARLKCILVFACIIFVFTLAYAVFLLVFAIRRDEEFTIGNNGSYFAFVPCLISNLWSGLLIYDTRRFIGMFDEQYGGSSLPYRLK